MRLAEGIVVDKEKTFGKLRFSGLRREVQSDDTGEIKRRTYDLKSDVQGMMIQVSVPADIPLKDFDYNQPVDLLNPVVNTVATATFSGAEVSWYVTAGDITAQNDPLKMPNSMKRDERPKDRPETQQKHE